MCVVRFYRFWWSCTRNPHIPLFHPPAYPRIYLPENLFRNLHNLAVVGEKAVQFVFDVGQLGVYGGRESLCTSRQDLFFIEPPIGPDQFLARGDPFVAEVHIVPGMICDAIVVAAEFREDDSAAPAILFVMVRMEIDVVTLKVARSLVVPSAGVVDRSGRVIFADL